MTVSTTQLDEVSSISTTLGKSDAVQRMIRYLHQNKGAPHDLKFMSIAKDELDWGAFKKIKGWLLFKCDKGIAAVQRTSSHGNYILVMSNDAWVNGPSETDPETGVVTTAIERARDTINAAVSPVTAVYVQVVNDLIEIPTIDRKDALLRAIRAGVGKIKEMYVARVTDAHLAKQTNRALKPAETDGSVSALVKKFKPILLRAVTQADAELSGVVSIAIKSKSYDRATKIVAKLRSLSKLVSNLESGSGTGGDIMSDAVRYAVSMTAVREFDITDARISGWSERINVDVQPRYFKEILDRAAAGDGKIVSELLYYFKRYMMLVK